jgi:phospholipid/cholesterol/gamma-HCH transport system substrate-binding protein
MRKNTGKKVVLGVFVCLGALFFTIAIYYIGRKQQLFNATFRISGLFKDVYGLQVGNNVRFSGINVGVVEDITIMTDTTVKVDIMINEDTRRFIRKDAKAIIGTDGLMGSKILTILPGTSHQPPIGNNDFIRTTSPVSFDDILSRLKTTGDNAAIITNDLATIIANIRAGRGTVGKLFMDTAFAETIDKTVVELKEGASGFTDNMQAARQSFIFKGLFKKKRDKTVKEKRTRN